MKAEVRDSAARMMALEVDLKGVQMREYAVNMCPYAVNMCPYDVNVFIYHVTLCL